MLSICQSIIVKIETNIVLNEWCHHIFERFPWFSAGWYNINITIPWMVYFIRYGELLIDVILRKLPQTYDLVQGADMENKFKVQCI